MQGRADAGAQRADQPAAARCQNIHLTRNAGYLSKQGRPHLKRIFNLRLPFHQLSLTILLVQTNKQTTMSIKYQAAPHEKSEIIIQNYPITAIRYFPHGGVSAKDLAAATGFPEDVILAYAGPKKTADVSFPTILDTPHQEIDQEQVIHLSAAVEFLESRAFRPDLAIALRGLFEQHLTGNLALIRDGLTASGRQVHQILEVKEDFATWVHQIRKTYPFYGITANSVDPKGDFPIVLNLVERLAMDSGIFAGKVMKEIVADCGFYGRSYLRKPFSDVVEDYQSVIPSMNNNRVDARRVHRIREEGSTFDLWLNSLTDDFPMVWGVDYFSETPIPEWNVDQPIPPPRVKGPVHFTPDLVEEIFEYPIYSVDYQNFETFADSVHAGLRFLSGAQDSPPAGAERSNLHP